MTSKLDKAAMWLRVSTDDQDLASQRRALMDLASTRGYETDDRITYELKGISAWKGDHSVYLKDALADARAGRFKYLLIWAFDRLSREGSEEALRIVREFEEAGVTVVSHQEPYIESTSEDREVMIAIAGSTARRESSRRSSRMKLSNDQRRSQGKVTNRSPYGYRGDRKTGLRVIDEPNTRIVRLMFDMYDATRMSIRGIQKLLNDRYPPPLGEKKKKKAVWSNETIRRILRRKIYTGGVDLFGVDTPQLITCEQFERVQARLSANYRRKPATKRVLPLQGRMTCVCGGHVHYDAATRGQGNDYYRCRNVYSHSYHVMQGGIPCGIKSQLAQRVHQRLRDVQSLRTGAAEKLEVIELLPFRLGATETMAPPPHTNRFAHQDNAQPNDNEKQHRPILDQCGVTLIVATRRSLRVGVLLKSSHAGRTCPSLQAAPILAAAGRSCRPPPA